MSKEKQKSPSKYTRACRLSAFLACMALFVLSGTALANGQNAGTKSIMTLKQVFELIEQKTGCTVAYSSTKLDLSRKVEIDTDKISDELNVILARLGFKANKEGNHIVVVPATTTVHAPQQKGQEHKVTGIVKDTHGEPIIGASVIQEGTSNGVVTDLEGMFKLSAPIGSKLNISFIGYTTKQVQVRKGELINVTLEENAKALEEVVVTAYGVGQKKGTMVGSVQQIRPAELKVPSSSLSSAFAGRLAGVIAVQRSGQPGADGSNFWIRGKSTFSGSTGALIILDGVQVSAADLNALDPEAIEGFSILKDATATAMYGTLGANGVMVVTTKSGADLDKPIINFRVEGAMSQLTDVPSLVGGVEYMKLYNEAQSRYEKPSDLYSDEKINATMAGLNPLIYPNVNWYDEMFKKNSFGQRVNFNIRGGSRKMDYFMSVSVKHDNGNLKSISKDYFSYNNNIDLYQYDFVNNLNIHATRTTKISLGLNVGLRDYSGPNKAPNDIFGSAMSASPVDFPIRFPAQSAEDRYILWGDKSGGLYNGGYQNPIAEYVTGYTTEFSSKVVANFKLEQKLDMITKGLRFSGLFSFKNWTLSKVNRTSAYNHFQAKDYNPETGEYGLEMIGNENETSLKIGQGNSGDRTMYIQAIMEYSRTFNEVHDVNAMMLYNQQEYNVNLPGDLFASLPQRKQGIAGRVSYAYDNRYMMEANFGYNGSENFAKDNRFGFFPSIAVGYNISEEKFWTNIKNTISNLKFRASYGLVGNENTGAGRFSYLEDIVLGAKEEWNNSYTTGINQDKTFNGPHWNRFYNPTLTWEIGKKFNVGMDIQLFNELNMTLEYFKESRKNIYGERIGTVPGIIGTGVALGGEGGGVSPTRLYANLGKMENHGIDFALDYNKQINKNLFVSFKGTFTFAQNKVLFKDEPPYLNYPNLRSIGFPTGVNLGYLSDGLFKDQEMIDNSPSQKALGGEVKPGDIKYIDIDKNGIIDSNDRVHIGCPTDPEIIYGFGPSIKYKKWDFSLFFQGAARSSLMMSGFHPFGNNSMRGVLDFVAENRWTEENQNIHAEYPRLSRMNNDNNTQVSDYWLRNAAFLKLKNAEIGFTYKKMRFYLNGTNLLTFSSFNYWDPEMGGGSGMKYPTQRTINIGFQMTIN